MSSKVMYVITRDRFSILAKVEYYPIVWLDHLLCIRHQLAAHLEKEILGLCDELPPHLAQDHFPKP